ncbi:protein of unknown function [Candidatus Nitrosocaldus cavascurensis]|uniref:Uncharacterized protein n=1 Tax=Candidatus Nitrosocaldus cavascurensis TaxID=2058097 RepID=A0A2K5AQA1_9ARCH|nr:protein of unknown function [Candidatus Nitrosocaldus cavascurensis]
MRRSEVYILEDPTSNDYRYVKEICRKMLV